MNYNFISKLENILNLKLCILILIFLGVFAIFFSNIIYSYDLTNQDANEYIEYARDLRNFHTLPQVVAMRFLPAFIVNMLSNIFSISIELSFAFSTYISFIALLLICFLFFKNNGLSNYIALSMTGVVIFGNISILYNLFNYYQLPDLLLYLFIFIQLILIEKNEPFFLFIISLLSVVTKEYLIFFSIASFIIQFNQFKNKTSLIYLLTLILLFFLFLYFMSNPQINSNNDTIFVLNQIILKELSIIFYCLMECFIEDKNFLMLIPYVFVLFLKNFYSFCKKYFFYLMYMTIPIFFSIVMYGQMGDNFFRIFNQGFIIFIIYGILFICKNTDNKFGHIILILLPITFAIDYIFVFFNIRNHGFYEYFMEIRYYSFSSFYIFTLAFVMLIYFSVRKV